MKDQFGRSIDYLRVSVTDHCNFRCQYCMPEEGVDCKEHQEILRLEEIYAIILQFVQRGVKKIRLTGGEPLVRKGVEELIEAIGHLEPVTDLAMTTNASLLKDRAKSLKRKGLDRVNVSMDSLNPQVFQALCAGSLSDAWQGIEAALDAGLGVKINSVLMKGINDQEIEQLAALTEQFPIDVRFIELMPMGQTKDFAEAHFLPADYVLEQVELEEIESDDPSAPARLYRKANGLGRVGLIRPLSDHFCSTCNRMRLTADGMLRPCLHSDLAYDLKSKLRAGQDFGPLIDQALGSKPKEHHLLEGDRIQENMTRIGG